MIKYTKRPSYQFTIVMMKKEMTMEWIESVKGSGGRR